MRVCEYALNETKLQEGTEPLLVDQNQTTRQDGLRTSTVMANRSMIASNQTTNPDVPEGRATDPSSETPLVSLGDSPQIAKGMEARIGQSACIRTEWISQTAVACVTPAGKGTFVPSKIMIGDQWSPEPNMHDLWYDPLHQSSTKSWPTSQSLCCDLIILYLLYSVVTDFLH